MNLTHLILDAGRTTRGTWPDGVPEEVLEQLRPVVADGVGAVPLFEGWFLDIRRLGPAPGGGEDAPQGGGAFFKVSEEPPPSRTPAAMAVACCSDANAEACWDTVDGIYRALRPDLSALGLWRAPPRRPPPVPWLATWLTPHAAAADPAVLNALAPLERAVAIILAEG